LFLFLRSGFFFFFLGVYIKLKNVVGIIYLDGFFFFAIESDGGNLHQS